MRHEFVIRQKPADIIIDPDGSVWVSMEPIDDFAWRVSYIEYEELHGR